MTWKPTSLVAFVLLLGTRSLLAQGSATPKSNSTIDPTGKFDVEVALASGQSGTGRLVISGTPDHYQGTLAADGGQGPLSIKSVSFAQDSVLVSVAPPNGGDGGIVMHLKFAESGFAGRFEGAESGQIKGIRIR